MENNMNETSMLKKYFCTPKVPITFYYTPLIPILIFWIVINLGNLNFNFKGILALIIFIAPFILVNYAYAWFSDYMLYKSKNLFVRYIFMKSAIFHRGFKSGAMAVYNSIPNENFIEVTGNRYKIKSSREKAIKTTFIVTFILLPLFKFLVAYAMLPFIIITPFLHTRTMKKYYDLVAADANDTTDQVDMF
ncbi:hypothetical protein RW115_11810 [Macrococcus capreoli]